MRRNNTALVIIVFACLILLSGYAFGWGLPKRPITVKDYTETGADFLYNGQMKNAKFDGEGTISFPNGDTYTGFFKRGLPDGKGMLTTAAGEQYECVFEEGTLIKNNETQ